MSMKRYVQRAYEKGIWGTFAACRRRVRTAWTDNYLRYKVKLGLLNYSWKRITAIHKTALPFEQFFTQKVKSDCHFFEHVHALYGHVPSDELVQLADFYQRNGVDLLGSGPQTFEKMPWHTDFRVRKQSADATASFDKHLCSKDIKITPGFNGATLAKDIKVPWELSRFQHLYVLGAAYKKTGDAKYVDTFVAQLQDWLIENPVLQGPNWVCPMDVGIRALNWIWAWYFFKDADIPLSFWQNFTESLYDHLQYLAHNWEVYDGRTSNHYLSDLVGYLYLTIFFKDLPGMDAQMQWCYQQIVGEFAQQVFDEGTDYEGSSSYHILVTELFFHAFTAARMQGLPVTSQHEEKLGRMFSFIDALHINQKERVKIGDDDSGKILFFGVTQELRQHYAHKKMVGTQHFAEFGISVVKNDLFHLTLRHHVYKARQPSGHFHNDVGSITLAYKGTPMLIDPGSYLYTPSVYWRNYFRSVNVHNTCYIDNLEPCELDENLFYLPLADAVMPQESQKNILSTVHHLYAAHNCALERKIEIDESALAITLSDCINKVDQSAPLLAKTIFWNFTLAPTVHVVQDKAGLVVHAADVALRLESPDILWIIEDSWYAPGYGTKLPTKAIRGHSQLVAGATFTIKFIFS